eukprot:UN19202
MQIQFGGSIWFLNKKGFWFDRFQVCVCGFVLTPDSSSKTFMIEFGDPDELESWKKASTEP